MSAHASAQLTQVPPKHTAGSILGPLFRPYGGHPVRTLSGVSPSEAGRQKLGCDVAIVSYLQDAARARNLVSSLSIAHDRYGKALNPTKTACLRIPAVRHQGAYIALDSLIVILVC